MNKLLHPSTLAAAIILVGTTGCGTNQVTTGLGEFAGRLYDVATNNTASDQARKMEDPYFPDERRDGIARLSNRTYGRSEPYTTRYQQIAQTDDDFIVRAAAIRALNRARDDSATPIFVKGLTDKQPQIRLESAKALANLPDSTAVPTLLRIVADTGENKDIRIAATDALKHYRKNEVARALVSLLNDRDFGVSWQARESLRIITGRDLEYDEAAWLALLSGAENPLS